MKKPRLTKPVPVFVDAQEMHRKYPDTFEVPTPDELAAVKPGRWVKVCVADLERFWVEVKERTGNTITGRVDNDLLYTDEHGLKLNSTITFEPRHIYSVMEGQA